MNVVLGVLAGVVGGFALARSRTAELAKTKIQEVAGDAAVYNRGWFEGKNFFKANHDVNHPDCNSCPH